jgi:hypothetical protein
MFTASMLQAYLYLYWTKFAETQYPIIHRPTFKCVGQTTCPISRR